MAAEYRLDLTRGSIPGKLVRFALPLMAGNLLQQFYNLADTLVVGRFLGREALAAVGSAYTLMTFLTSILIGLCMGSGVCFSILFGEKKEDEMKQAFFLSFAGIAAASLALTGLAYLLLSPITALLNIPADTAPLFQRYLRIIFAGIFAVFLYNYFANLLRALGNSFIPLVFLAVSSLSNVALDLFFVVALHWGVEGAALATVIAQYLSGIGVLLYYRLCCPALRVEARHRKWSRPLFLRLASLSAMTCVQQSIMNLGILMVQGLVNSFGTVVMAAFAAGVKIDTVAYSPVQDFGNAFSTFIAQNYGAGEERRIRKGIRTALLLVFFFCAVMSCLVAGCARPLMGIFVSAEQAEVIAVGVGYLRVEGACYLGIGVLFLLYGYYRAIERPGMSIVLTVLSLGTRVVLAYLLSALPGVGVTGIWAAIPIGWALADTVGLLYGRRLFRGNGAKP